MFDNYDCIHKKYIRGGLLGRLINKYHTNDRITTVTLPAEKFVLERDIRKVFPDSNIITCERDFKLYKQQKLGDHSAIYSRHIHGNINDVVKIYNNANLVWLDYCCQLNASLIDPLLNVFELFKDREDYILALTLMGCREQKVAIREFCTKINEKVVEYKKVRECLLPEKLASILGVEDFIMERYKGERGTPMYTYIFEK